MNCKKRFTTYERVELAPLVVIKKDGRRERFNRNKLRISLMKALEKRPISQDKIEAIVDGIETKLRNMDRIEIKSKVIGEMVMEKLQKLDKVAYIRFASVYRDFKDIRSFEKEIKRLKE
jgi:transcriptional repressor NrdR